VIVEIFRRPSLVRRLVVLAAGWSLAALLISALVMVLLFQQSALRRFNQNLAELVDNLVAGSTLKADGSVVAPALTDLRALRAYSGKYWQIARPAEHGQIRIVERSRSLWDSELPTPKDLISRLNAHPGVPVSYDTRGPLSEPLRALASQVRLPDSRIPLIFIVGEDRRDLDRDIRRFTTATAIILLALGAGLVGAVVIQVQVGLTPLFALRREIAEVRGGKSDHILGTYPSELTPLAEELNA